MLIIKMKIISPNPNLEHADEHDLAQIFTLKDEYYSKLKAELETELKEVLLGFTGGKHFRMEVSLE